MFSSAARLILPSHTCASASLILPALGVLPQRIVTRRFYSSTNILYSRMADLKVELTAPNGRKITLPTGLFINNEFVKSSSGDKITSINPS
jgi:hypothetical protein